MLGDFDENSALDDACDSLLGNKSVRNNEEGVDSRGESQTHPTRSSSKEESVSWRKEYSERRSGKSDSSKDEKFLEEIERLSRNDVNKAPRKGPRRRRDG